MLFKTANVIKIIITTEYVGDILQTSDIKLIYE